MQSPGLQPGSLSLYQGFKKCSLKGKIKCSADLEFSDAIGIITEFYHYLLRRIKISLFLFLKNAQRQKAFILYLYRSIYTKGFNIGIDWIVHVVFMTLSHACYIATYEKIGKRLLFYVTYFKTSLIIMDLPALIKYYQL